VPQQPCPVCPRLDQEFEPWRQAAYWRSMQQRALARAQRLRQENEQWQARIRSREQRLFGRKSEAGRAAAPADPGGPRPLRPSRPRGQRRGRPGPPRRDYSHLPAVEEVHDLPADQRHGPQCGQPFAPFPGTGDGTVLEVEVRAHRRLIRRRRDRPRCACGGQPGLSTAPPPPKVIPQSILGISVWVEVSLDKYLFYRPTYRLRADLAPHGLDLSLGTRTDGRRRRLPLLGPVYDALVARSQRQALWHADETRWLVFAPVAGQVG
jgi:transposase